MKLKTIAAAVALSLGASSAFAVTTPIAGVTGYAEWKFTGYTTEAFTTPGVGCTSGAGGSNGCETTWGIGLVNSITNGSSNIWAEGANGEYLYYMIYGIADLVITPGGANGNNIYNVGASNGVGTTGNIHIDLYLTNSPYSFTGKTANLRSAFDEYDTLTAGSPYLSLVLVPGGTADDPGTVGDESLTTTLFQNVSAQTLPATGVGAFYANVVGGTGMTKWNTNGFDLPFNNLFADFKGKFDLDNNSGNGAVPSNSVTNGFPGNIHDPLESFAVPEPTSLALLGLGLAGLALRRRRKVA